MFRALITTVPFADKNRLPIELLESAGIDYLVNPIGRKLKEDELAKMVTDFDVLIAGTEPITDQVMRQAWRLKLISRVGIGLDSVDLLAAERRGIKVSYTPDAPAPAVAELTVGLMLFLLRFVHVANAQLHRGEWHRHLGRRIPEVLCKVRRLCPELPVIAIQWMHPKHPIHLVWEELLEPQLGVRSASLARGLFWSVVCGEASGGNDWVGFAKTQTSR